MKNILPDLWETIKNKKILKWLNDDNLGAIILDCNVFWFEMHPGCSMPNFARTYFIQLLTKKGFKYLYNS